MLGARLCELLGIELPIVQAPLGPWSSVELTAAVSNTGAIGSLGTALRTANDLREDVRKLRELTDRPFIVNHTLRPLDEDAFAATIELRPRAISLALGDPVGLVERAHDIGAVFVQQVHAVGQARLAAERGVDVVIAQGTEAGGFGGDVALTVLLPQVVEAVAPIPVLAAGGIADGRGLAAAFVLGAEGANIGTRFLASRESGIPESWKRRILEAESEDAVKLEFADQAFPPPSPGGFAGTRPRVLRTPFAEEWNDRREDAAEHSADLGAQVLDALRSGRAHELIPFTGQTAGLIRDVPSAAEIVRRLVTGAEEALSRAAGELRTAAPQPRR